MQTYSPYRVRSVQPEFLEKLEQPIAESTKGWTVRKRDGSIVDFDIQKIKAALLRCFNNVVSEQNVAMPDVDPILEYVVLPDSTAQFQRRMLRQYPRTVLISKRIFSIINSLASFRVGMIPRSAARLGRKLYSTVSSLGSRIFLRSRTN